MEKAIERWVEANKSPLVSISDKVWAHAELGLVERESAKLQMEYLQSQGFEIKAAVGGMETAFVASWG
ncbi:MAG TPA: amidohydrolase, partial [Firmicutes bacterium]|nr:amidohydrolase [Candidatus Fermentithermobacillaceae bacterium]